MILNYICKLELALENLSYEKLGLEITSKI